MKIIEALEGKNILIWGYGREGKATEAFIKRYCQNVKYEIFEGKKEDFDETKFDLIIKSPGIPYFTNDPKYTSETRLFVDEFKDQIIAITGSKGKSTTSSLLYKTLLNDNRKAILVGNIGYPCFDYYDQIDNETFIVFEISAHQLLTINSSPHIGIFLNLYEEHLDYYKTMDKYFNAKANIGRFQKPNDYLLLGENVPNIICDSKVIRIENIKHFEMNLLGEHNQYNANFVYYVAHELLHIKDNVIIETFKNFENLKHRIDYIGNINGVDYYDDSISTIPQATINAIKSISNAQTIIIGGMDRGIDYTALINYINNNENYNYILMYASGKRIYDNITNKNSCVYVPDLINAVKKAKTITQKGKACVLSPAAASYDSFKNFEERGDKYIEYIKDKNII